MRIRERVPCGWCGPPTPVATETGLNRAYGPSTKKGGAMLDQRSGGIDFWYKAVSAQSAELCVYAIAMDADAVEKTGDMRAKFTVPPHHIGDGQWHHGRLKYDFSGNPKVRWVQFAARIVGTAGELLLDDVSYVERVGMLLRVSDIRLEEDNDRPGELCVVRAKIENAGDAEVTGLRATIQLPEGLAATPAEVQIDRLAPDRATRAVWKVQGSRRNAGRFEVKARVGDVEEQAHLDLRFRFGDPQLRPRSPGGGRRRAGSRRMCAGEHRPSDRGEPRLRIHVRIGNKPSDAARHSARPYGRLASAVLAQGAGTAGPNGRQRSWPTESPMH